VSQPKSTRHISSASKSHVDERAGSQAESLDIPLCTLNEKSTLDVAIDGADAVDPDFALVKGGGGALLREKMVEVMAKKFICIVDDSKLCKGLGPSFALPVEIVPFCSEHTLRTIAALPELAGGSAVIRTGDCSNNKVPSIPCPFPKEKLYPSLSRSWSDFPVWNLVWKDRGMGVWSREFEALSRHCLSPGEGRSERLGFRV
jgi:hypothetical protein